MHYYKIFTSPIGEILLISNGDSLCGLHMRNIQPQADWRKGKREFLAAEEQLSAYFAGELTTFDLPLAMAGTDFQQKVWRALEQIPYGKTVSYSDIANKIRSPKAVRAVGAANGRNPISIIVPCHRVIGANGSLTGYAGGIDNKKWLLEHEGCF